MQTGTIGTNFGDMVRTFCNWAAEDEKDLKKVIFRKVIFEELQRGFLEIWQNDLQDIEYQQLTNCARLTILVQAIRFLTDYLQGNIYYKTDYARHNLVRARNQLHLFQQLNNA